MPATIDPLFPVTSLDQLYMQAIVANTILLDKVCKYPEARLFCCWGSAAGITAHAPSILPDRLS